MAVTEKSRESAFAAGAYLTSAHGVAQRCETGYPPSGCPFLIRTLEEATLQNLFVMASDIQILLTTVLQASQALRDEQLLRVSHHLQGQNKRQLSWLDTEIKHRAPHTLVVPT